MDIFEATLKLKKFIHEGNPQLVKINGVVERSGQSPLPLLLYHEKVKNIKKDYDHRTKVFTTNYVFDPEYIQSTRRLKWGSYLFRYDDLMPSCVDTKEYWNFLHKNFPFCDVASYYRVTDLNSYFDVKGKHYDAIVKALGIGRFKNKKILEIGPGYGYLPKVLKEHNVPCNYYCADIVHRFDHDNFIDVSGYTLSNITEKFDVIIMQDVMQHLSREILDTYAREIHGMLNDGGVFIIGNELSQHEDHVGYFFGQTYVNFGYDSLQRLLINELKFDHYYYQMILNNKHTGHIFVYQKPKEC